MLKGFQKAACKSAATITATPLKMVIQKGYDAGSERSFGSFGLLKISSCSSLQFVKVEHDEY